MRTYESDVNWWIREANNDPSTAAEIVGELSKRIVILQEENEALKAENIALNRAGNRNDFNELQKMKTVVNKLTNWLKQEGLNNQTVACITSNGKGLQFPYSLLSTSDGLHFQFDSTNFDNLYHVFPTYRHTSLLFLSSTFQVYQDYSFAIPYSDAPGSLKNLEDLDFAEKEISVICEEQATKGKAFIVIVTSQGIAKKVAQKTFLDFTNTNHNIIAGERDDEPIQLVPSMGRDLFLVTKRGYWIRFSFKHVSIEGTHCLELIEEDEIVGAIEVDDRTNIFFVGTDGSVIAIRSSAFARSSKIGRRGRRLPTSIQPITCFTSRRKPHALWLTKQGEIGLANLDVVPIVRELKHIKRVNPIKRDLLACSPVSQ